MTDQTLYVQLGKIGDICNLLPLLQADAEAGHRSKLMVASEFAPVLEGCGYVEPVIYSGPHYEIAKAVQEASKTGCRVICAQFNGPIDETREYTYRPAGQTGAVTTSFNIESWQVANRLKDWYRYLPLVFDRRSPEREAKLVETHMVKRRGTQKRWVLLYTGGASSPFPYAQLLRELVRLEFDRAGYGIIDLGNVKADRFYDLLALYERAHVLISTDSAPLHLARAVPSLPVVALANDKPLLWNGSAWQPNHIWHGRYSDFPHQAQNMMWAIEKVSHKSEVLYVFDGPQWTDTLNSMSSFPVWKDSTGRTSSNTIGDDGHFPYLKDCLRHVLQVCNEARKICLIRPGTVVQETKSMLEHDLVYAYRISREAGRETFMPIADLFCAKASWWREHLKEIPDLILGKDWYWSQALWALFKECGAHDATGMIYRVKE